MAMITIMDIKTTITSKALEQAQIIMTMITGVVQMKIKTT